MKERSSDKMNQNLDQTSHVRGHEKKAPYGPREHFFPLISSQGKKYKKLLQLLLTSMYTSLLKEGRVLIQ